jgi:hypothetical protein
MSEAPRLAEYLGHISNVIQGPAQPLLDARSPGAKVPGLLTFTDPFLIG